MPKIPLYNQGLGSAVPLATGQLSPRASIQALTAADRARASFFDKASQVSFEFGQQVKQREADSVYAEEFLRLQDEGNAFNLNNKDTDHEVYQGNWETFQNSFIDRIKTRGLTESQANSIISKLAPEFGRINVSGKSAAYTRGQNIASSNFQSLTDNDIDTIANLPMMHPDRVAIENKIKQRTNDAIVNDLDIGKYTPQFVENQVELRTVQKSINAADTLADVDGVENLIEMSKNLTDADLKSLRPDVKAARERVRNQNIATLTSNMSLDVIGTEITSKEQIDSVVEQMLSEDAFKDNPNLQAMYDDLDDVGKKQYIDAVEKQAKNMEQELRFENYVQDRRTKEANEETYQNLSDRILSFDSSSNVPSVAEITNATFEGADGERLRDGLLEMLDKRMKGNVLTQSSPTTYIKTKNAILTDQITSITQPFTLPNEVGQEGFAGQVSFKEGKNLMERAGEIENGLGFKDYDELQKLLNTREKASESSEAAVDAQNDKIFNNWLKSNEDLIKGNKSLQSLDIGAEGRFYEFEVIMNERYRKAIQDGKNPRDLVDPRHPDYIFKDPEKFALTFREQIETITNSYKEPELEDGQIPADLEPPQKPADMSMDDWVNSDTYKDYYEGSQSKYEQYKVLKSQIRSQ